MGLTGDYPEVEGLGVELIFNKNVIKPGDNKEYIKEAIDTIAILRVKRGCYGTDLAYITRPRLHHMTSLPVFPYDSIAS